MLRGSFESLVVRQEQKQTDTRTPTQTHTHRHTHTLKHITHITHRTSVCDVMWVSMCIYWQGSAMGVKTPGLDPPHSQSVDIVRAASEWTISLWDAFRSRWYTAHTHRHTITPAFPSFLLLSCFPNLWCGGLFTHKHTYLQARTHTHIQGPTHTHITLYQAT